MYSHVNPDSKKAFKLFGIEAVVYVLVGLSGLWMVWMKFAGGKK